MKLLRVSTDAAEEAPLHSRDQWRRELYAWKRPRSKKSLLPRDWKAVIAALLSCMNVDGVGEPLVSTIAKRAKCSNSYAEKVIRVLDRAGWITREGRKRTEPGREKENHSSVYRIAVDGVPWSPPEATDVPHSVRHVGTALSAEKPKNLTARTPSGRSSRSKGSDLEGPDADEESEDAGAGGAASHTHQTSPPKSFTSSTPKKVEGGGAPRGEIIDADPEWAAIGEAPWLDREPEAIEPPASEWRPWFETDPASWREHRNAERRVRRLGYRSSPVAERRPFEKQTWDGAVEAVATERVDLAGCDADVLHGEQFELAARGTAGVAA
jgi:hypothetical protein